MAAGFVKLLVSDAERSARFYEALGFERVGALPPFIQLRWPEGLEVYLVTPPAALGLEGRRGLGVLVGIRGEKMDLDDVARRARELGAQVDGPQVQPWYTREVIVTDPDGYRLDFIEPA